MQKAVYIIDLKISDVIKNSSSLSYSELRQKILNLKQQKMEIYNYNENTIDKVLRENLQN